MTDNQKIAFLIAVSIFALWMCPTSLFTSDYEEAAKLEAYEQQTKGVSNSAYKS